VRTTLLAAGLALATVAPAAPAAAVPPLYVTGSGAVMPGFYPTPTPLWPNAVSFQGTAADPTGTAYACGIRGVGVNYSPGQITGFADIACGPSSAVSCPFTMTATTWTLACAGGGSLTVSFVDPLYFKSFTASGMLT